MTTPIAPTNPVQVNNAQRLQTWKSFAATGSKHQHSRTASSSLVQNMVANPPATPTPAPNTIVKAPPAATTTLLSGKGSLVNFTIPGTNLNISI